MACRHLCCFSFPRVLSDAGPEIIDGTENKCCESNLRSQICASITHAPRTIHQNTSSSSSSFSTDKNTRIQASKPNNTTEELCTFLIWNFSSHSIIFNSFHTGERVCIFWYSFFFLVCPKFLWMITCSSWCGHDIHKRNSSRLWVFISFEKVYSFVVQSNNTNNINAILWAEEKDRPSFFFRFLFFVCWGCVQWLDGSSKRLHLRMIMFGVS